VAKDGKLLGVVRLKDIVKGGIRERFAELRRMGIRTVMITGDNPMTAAAIAAEAGVDDSSPRRRQRKSSDSSVTSRPRASLSPCAAMAPTMRRRWRRPTWASP
jgi:magnesium-transporting ATPase (P-type)